MHDYLFSIEVVRLAFMAGVIVSVLMYERYHVTTGSIVVPGYMGVFLLQPTVMVATFVVALFTYWFVNRVIVRWRLLYGRSKFTALVLTSTVCQFILLRTSPSGSWLWEADIPLLVGAGFIVPALIAHDMGRQGLMRTSKSVAVAGLIVATPVVATALLFPTLRSGQLLAGFGVLAIEPEWVPIAVLIGTSAAWALLHNYKLRAGGFIGATYIAMLSTTPWNLVFMLVVEMLALFVVTQILRRKMILFGRRKFAIMILAASVFAWGGTWLGSTMLGFSSSAYESIATVALTPLFIPGLVANDSERTGPATVLLGVIVGASFVLTTVWWLAALFGVPPAFDVNPMAAMAASLVLGCGVFGPQINNTVSKVAARLDKRGGARRVRPRKEV